MAESDLVERLRADIARRDHIIATLTAERDAALFAARNGKSLAEGALEEVRKVCREVGSPVQAFIDDDVRCAIATLTAERDEARDMLGRAEWWLSTFPAGAVMRAEIRKVLGWPPVEEPTWGHHQQREEKQ